MILISSKNIAPSAEHKTHDVYSFSINASDVSKPFIFEQSIGGGHAEQGGAAYLSINELGQWPGDWRFHLKNSGCEWVIDIFEKAIDTGNSEEAISEIICFSRKNA